MPKLMRNALVVAKIEGAYGTDAAPTAALNAILCRGVTPQPLVAEFVERSLLRATLGNMGQVNVANHSEIEFEVELQSSGAAGTAPKWAPLLRGCGFSETLAAGVSATYAPVSTGQESLTLWYYVDGLLHKMTGARGSVSLGLSAKQIPVMKFKFVGKYVAPTDSPVATGAVFTGFIDPVAVNKTNTTTLTLHGVAVTMQSFDIDVANNVIFRALVNDESIYITDRKPAGSMSFEMTALATKDWFSTVVAGTQSPVQMIHGAGAGKIIEINGPKVQITNPQYADSEGIVMLNAALQFMPNNGNDELTIVAR